MLRSGSSLRDYVLRPPRGILLALLCDFNRGRCLSMPWHSAASTHTFFQRRTVVLKVDVTVME